MDICGKTDISKIHTLKNALSSKNSRTGEDEVLLWHKNKKPLFRYASDLPGNPRNGDFTAVKSTVFDEGKCGRQLKGFQGGTLWKSFGADPGNLWIMGKDHTSKLPVLLKGGSRDRRKCLRKNDFFRELHWENTLDPIFSTWVGSNTSFRRVQPWKVLAPIFLSVSGKQTEEILVFFWKASDAIYSIGAGIFTFEER